MQTFLPYPCYTQSAKCLDKKRLNNQRSECVQIWRALSGETKGWVNHPTTRMWRGYEQSLLVYSIAMCEEFILRGGNDNVDRLHYFKERLVACYPIKPPWVGDEAFHSSHRSNLLRKDYNYYSKFVWKEPQDLPYVWPV